MSELKIIRQCFSIGTYLGSLFIFSLIRARVRKAKCYVFPLSKSGEIQPKSGFKKLTFMTDSFSVWIYCQKKQQQFVGWQFQSSTLLPHTFLQMCSHKKKTQIHMSVAFIASFPSLTTAYVCIKCTPAAAVVHTTTPLFSLHTDAWLC